MGEIEDQMKGSGETDDEVVGESEKGGAVGKLATFHSLCSICDPHAYQAIVGTEDFGTSMKTPFLSCKCNVLQGARIVQFDLKLNCHPSSN